MKRLANGRILLAEDCQKIVKQWPQLGDVPER